MSEPEPPEFLSASWVHALATHAAPAAGAARQFAAADVCVQHVVTAEGGAVVRYWVRIDGDGVATGVGDAAAPDVTVTCDRDTARELHDGTLNAQEAFRAGRLRLRGDVAKLARVHEAMTGTKRS